MEKFKIYSMWTSAKSGMLGLHIHLSTNGFPGAMEGTAELLNVEPTSTVLMPGPPLQGAEGPQRCLQVLLT